MGYIFRVTALRDQWGGVIKKGETFTLVESSSSPNSATLGKQLKSMGRNFTTSTSLPSMGLNDKTKNINGWLIENLGKN